MCDKRWGDCDSGSSSPLLQSPCLSSHPHKVSALNLILNMTSIHIIHVLILVMLKLTCNGLGRIMMKHKSRASPTAMGRTLKNWAYWTIGDWINGLLLYLVCGNRLHIKPLSPPAL